MNIRVDFEDTLRGKGRIYDLDTGEEIMDVIALDLNINAMGARNASITIFVRKIVGDFKNIGKIDAVVNCVKSGAPDIQHKREKE